MTQFASDVPGLAVTMQGFIMGHTVERFKEHETRNVHTAAAAQMPASCKPSPSIQWHEPIKCNLSDMLNVEVKPILLTPVDPAVSKKARVQFGGRLQLRLSLPPATKRDWSCIVTFKDLPDWLMTAGYEEFETHQDLGQTVCIEVPAMLGKGNCRNQLPDNLCGEIDPLHIDFYWKTGHKRLGGVTVPVTVCLPLQHQPEQVHIRTDGKGVFKVSPTGCVLACLRAPSSLRHLLSKSTQQAFSSSNDNMSS